MPTKPAASIRSNSPARCSMPRWITAWAIVTSIVCTWDVTYILTRPRSMAKGDLFHIFFPYAKYITHDPLYANIDNSFVIGQSYMNCVEILLTLVSLVLYHLVGRRNAGCLMLLVINVMTWSKTMLYFIHDYLERSLHPQDPPIVTATLEYFFLCILPNSVWVIVPFACTWSLGRQILRRLDSSNEKNKSK